MKNRIISVFTAVLLIFTLAPCVFASAPVLVDNAGLLEEDEFNYVSGLLESAGEKHDASFVIVTVNDTDGKSMQDYADDYFDYNDYSYDGILLLIDMDRGEYYFSTCGKYDSYEVNYIALDTMESNILDPLFDGDFYGAFISFAEDCAAIDILSASESHSPTDNYPYAGYESNYREPFEWGSSIFIALIIGLIIAFIVTSVLKGQLKSVKQQTRAENYVVDGSMKVTEARDLFLYHHITRTPRPKSNSGSSGSHRSSSGRSHGGRGGSFR